ncbi:hypothetical protein AAF712_002514, partial [Marasmius tenuissimus]
MSQNSHTVPRRSTRLRGRPTTTSTDDSVGVEEAGEGANKRLQNGKGPKRTRDEEPDDLTAPQVDTKRSRTCHKRTNTKKLGMLLTLPLDVLYTIFGHLNPKALVSLTRVNRAFSATLLSPETMFIWVQARQSCDVPEPWENMTEVEWAKLLFGNTKCQFCGTKGVQRINFILMKRVCFVCIQAKFVTFPFCLRDGRLTWCLSVNSGISKGRFKSFYPDEDKGVLELVEHARGMYRVLPVNVVLISPFITGGGRANNTQYYNKEQIERVLTHLSVCRNPREVDTYVEERKAYLVRLNVVGISLDTCVALLFTVAWDQRARLCWDWVANNRYQRFKDKESTREERFTAIGARLREMGYADEDLDLIKWMEEVYEAKPLTKRSTIVTSRCNLISERYFSYKRTFTPLECRLNGLPSVQTIWCLPSMRRLIGLPENIEVTPVMIQDAITDEDYAEEIGFIQNVFVEGIVAYNRRQK